MIIFYPETGSICNPVVVLDALDSSDRYTDIEVYAQVRGNSPNGLGIALPSIFSCSYEFEFSHNGIPLGEGMKTQFTGAISSPPSALVAAFSPSFFVSAQSIDAMTDALSKFANPQMSVTHAALVVRDQNNNTFSRSFIAYAAQIQPDAYGATTTMLVHGGSFEDIIIKSVPVFQLDKTLPLSTQLSSLLSGMGYSAVFKTTLVNKPPVSEHLFPPSRLNNLLDTICLQNKLIPVVKGTVVTIYGQGDTPVSTAGGSKAEFSFLGSSGALAWGVGIENYANIRFKTPYFDAELFQEITIWNDIKSAFFEGLVTNGRSLLYNSYGAYVIRYILRRSQDEIVTEVTASNNWLLAQMRIDGILETAIYSGQLGVLQ